MTSFPKARQIVLESVPVLGTERVPLSQLGGRVFAGSLTCPFDVPHFDNSQVDGYAVRSVDRERWRIVQVASAGGPATRPLGPGEAARIFTGAAVPIGAEAIAMQEDAVVEGDLVSFREAPLAGRFIRRQGEEILSGTVFSVDGRTASPPLVGLAASFGQTEVEVYRRPRVTVVATGSELVPPGRPLRRGEVYASNPSALAEALRAVGVETIKTVIVRDEPAETAHALSQALEASDVLLTVGGVSVGDHDLVRPTLAKLGVVERIWRVSMKPGKPFYFGQHGERAVFGLPGNPVSALVAFQLLVRPFLRKAMGRPDAEEEIRAELGAPITRNDLRYEFVRATMDRGRATPLAAQGSHMQTGLAFANALIHVPDGVASLEAGAPVTVTPLRWTAY